MGIDYDGGIIVGVEGTDLALEENEELYGLIEKYDLETASPFYDADLESRIIGKWVSSTVAVKDLDKLIEECQKVKRELESIPAFDSCTIQVYGTQDIT